MIESLVGLDCLEASDKALARLDCFETKIKTQQGWTVLRPKSIESIDEGDNKDLV